MGALVIGVGGHFVEGPRGLKAQTTPPTAVVRVAPGDTLETIAARHGVDLTQLIQRNSLANPDLLQVGQLLQLPPPRGLVPVVPGDTLEGLALRHGTTVAALQRANPAVQPTALQVGQWLQLPTAAAGNSSMEAAAISPVSPGTDPLADPDTQAGLLLSSGERRDRATLTLRERSGQVNWRSFGSSQVDWSGWQLHPGGVRITLVKPSLADVGARRSGATAMAVQCSSLRHTWRVDGSWEPWSSPSAGSVGQRIVLQLCSNTLDGPAVAIPAPPDSGM